MIGYLKGTLLTSSPEQVILDVNGVGYAVHVPFSTYCEIESAGKDSPVELYIHTHVREDVLDLYGFATAIEKQVFEMLIAVSGIGPRLAQVVMSGMGWEELLAALAGGNAPRLVRIPGVGKKTAERMVLELKDAAAELRRKLDHEELPPTLPGREDVISALVNLGYRRSDAERAAEAADREVPDEAFHELLRRSLKKLSRA